MGTPELPGVRRRVYYTSKNDILVWPKLPHNEVGRVTSSVYDGSFTLKENAVWKYIDILPEKSQLTSEAQGELPSQTQLNKLVAVHPSVSEAASAAAAYLNNNDNVFIVEDMKGKHLSWVVASGLPRPQSRRISVRVPLAPPAPLSTWRHRTSVRLRSILAPSPLRTATLIAQRNG